MRNQHFLTLMSSLILVTVLAVSCVSDINPVIDPGLQENAGLGGRGDLYVFPVLPRLTKASSSNLILMDKEGIREETLSTQILLMKNTMMKFDRVENSVCGLFRFLQEFEYRYLCYFIKTGEWENVSPPGYTVMQALWNDDESSIFFLAARSVYEEGAPWYYVLEVEAETNTLNNAIPVDPKQAPGNPQFIILSPDERKVFIITAPFEEESYRINFESPYLLQTLDISRQEVVDEQWVPPLITQAVVLNQNRMLLYSRLRNALYSFDARQDIVSLSLQLERSSNVLYNVKLIQGLEGVMIVDQTDSQTVVRKIDGGGFLKEKVSFEFLAFYSKLVEDGRLVFREYQLSTDDFEAQAMEDREERFLTVDAKTMRVLSETRKQLPGDTFYNSVFYLLPDPFNE